MIWWFHLENRPHQKDERKTKPQEYMADLNIVNYDELGNPKQRLQADYWAFIPLNGRSDLEKPHVTIYKPNGDVWHLSANQALAWHPTMADKIIQLDLIANVIIERTAENDGTPTKITTENMQYIPQDKILSSADYITMQQPGIIISGQGMLGYLDKNRIELHDNITTVYTKNVQ